MSSGSLELLMLKRIDKMKMKMINTASVKGMNSKETLTCSQQLDDLLNLHMKLFAKYRKIQ
jgi:Spo0E like sporulation regulatory protein